MPPNIGQVAELLDYGGPFVEFRQACTGFANALVFAQGLLRASAGPIAIVGSETGSVFFDPVRAAEDAGQLVNMVQMGDGAAAIILTRDDDRVGPRLSHVYYGQIGRGRVPGLTVADGGSYTPRCSIGFPEFQHDFAAIHRSGLELLLHCAAAAERTGGGAADYVLPHQANGRMDTILARPLGLAAERIIVTAGRLGNTGSAAMWLALAQVRATLKLRDRVAISLLALVPAVQIVLFGYAVNLDPKNVPIAIAGSDGSFVERAARIVGETGYFRIMGKALPSGSAERMVVAGRALVGIELPPSPDEEESGGAPARARVVVDATDPAVVRPALAALETAYWRKRATTFSLDDGGSIDVDWPTIRRDAPPGRSSRGWSASSS